MKLDQDKQLELANDFPDDGYELADCKCGLGPVKVDAVISRCYKHDQ